MDSIEIKQYGQYLSAANAFALNHTAKGRRYGFIAWLVLTSIGISSMSPYGLDLESAYRIFVVVGAMAAIYVCFLWTLGLTLSPDYNAIKRSTFADLTYRFTIRQSHNIFEVQKSETESTTHPLNEVRVHKKVGNIYLVHKNSVYMLPWTPSCLAFVKRINLGPDEIPIAEPI